ncbi:hypothetical protein ACQP10_01455 [Streptosporangium sandarakinum]|uniref:hypothetical protein n=1 Tax=Streptosporangium sandarakinum TaxID=1260955 RepID=UPI003D915B00
MTGTAAASRAATAITEMAIEGTVTKGNHIWCYIVTAENAWEQFDIATWRTWRSRLPSLLSVFALLVVIAVLLWSSGVITPQIRWRVDAFFVHAEVDENGVLSGSLLIEIENEASVPFTITGVSAEMPGLRLLPADEAKGEHTELTVGGGRIEVLERRVVITDCAAVPYEPQPVRFTYRTWMGSRSAEVTWDSWRLSEPEEAEEPEESGEFEGTVLIGDQQQSGPVAWQRGFAGMVCNDAMDPDKFR